jgi:hypothetical protein
MKASPLKVTLINTGEVHQMRSVGPDEVAYLAIGIRSQACGRTVVVEEKE